MVFDVPSEIFMQSSAKASAIEPWNKSKWEELQAHGVPLYWLLVSPLESEALMEGVVSASIQEQCHVLSKSLPQQPDPVFEASKPKP
jgi:hypothetical protein